MANYQESVVDGIKWRRCERIEISNPLAPGLPAISFTEQDVLLVDGTLTTVGNYRGPGLYVVYDPDAEIDVYDPVTLEPTGAKFKHSDLYAMLFSAYISTAIARDNAPPIAPPAPVAPPVYPTTPLVPPPPAEPDPV